MRDAPEPGSGGGDVHGAENADWEALRRMLIERAFFTSHEGAALRDRNGAQVPWLYHGSEVLLSAQGLELSGRLVASRLRSFAGCQLATYGTSAIPLLARCLAEGRHPGGIVIRKAPERYGIARTLEGPVDPARPVVVVDDSLSSGASLQAAFSALEDRGLQVRGAVCLLEFSGYGARPWLTARGYALDTVYDVWRDLERTAVPVPPGPVHGASWSPHRVPNGLLPAVAARRVAEHLLASGRLLQPPDAFDQEYDAGGGTFISVRRRGDDTRLARSGFRRDGPDVDPRLDVVLAAERAVHDAGLRTEADLRQVKLGVAFVSAPRATTVAEIDPARLALTVRGLEPLARAGFALPNAPHYDDEIQQLRYARTVGGRFGPLEPTEPFSHVVRRVVEPGETWPVHGATPARADWAESPTLAAAIAETVRRALRPSDAGSSSATPRCPEPGEAVAVVGVSLYRNGLVGCGTSLTRDLGLAIREATSVALADRRYGPGPAEKGDVSQSPVGSDPVAATETTAVVSLLVRPRVLGAVEARRLPLYFRLGRDTLEATGRGRRGLVLAHFAAQQDLDEETYRRQVLLKAGLGDAEASWSAYETLAWVVTNRGHQRLELGYPDRRPLEPRTGPGSSTGRPLPPVDLARRVAGFIVRQRLEDGLPAYRVLPWWGRVEAEGSATRVLIAATALAEAGPVLGEETRAAAESIADRLVEHGRAVRPRDGLAWDVAADAQLVQLLTAVGPRADRYAVVAPLAARLRALVRPDGAIHTGTARMSADLDLLSGSALLALARADAWVGGLAEVDLGTVLAFHRRRFRLAHPWGMVWWHAQAWAALARSGAHAGSPQERAAYGDFVLEMVDWAVERQSRASGAFVIDDMRPGRISFLSACVLEGVAEGLLLARERGDVERVERYAGSWTRGVRFLDRLVLHEDDVYFCPRPRSVLGGARAVLPSSELRIDVAGHALRALAKGLSGDRPGA